MTDAREVRPTRDHPAATRFAVRTLLTVVVGWAFILLVESLQQAGLVNEVAESALRTLVWVGVVGLLLYFAIRASLPLVGLAALSVFSICTLAGFGLGIAEDVRTLDNVSIIGRDGWMHHLTKKALFAGWACSIAFLFFDLLRSLDAANHRLETRVRERTAELKQARDELEERVSKRTEELSNANRELTAEVQEQRAAEASLAESERRLRLALDATQSICWDLDPETGDRIVAKPPVEWLGYAADEIASHRQWWREIIHPDDIEIPHQALKKLLIGNTNLYECEYRIRGKSGEWYWTGDKGIIVRGVEHSAAVHVVGTTTNISEYKQAELQLRESEERFRILVQNAPEAILVHDADADRFVDANQNAVGLFKLDRDSLLNVGPTELSRPEQANGQSTSELAQVMTQRALAGECPAFEWIFIDAEGNEIPCEVRLARLPSVDRKLIRGSIIDIRDRKQFEQQLHRLREELAVVTRRSTVGELATGLAHELNQPLGAIATYAFTARKVLKEPGPTDAIIEILDRLEYQAVHAGEIVRGIRRFVGSGVSVRSAEDINALIRDVLHLLDSEIRGKHVHADLQLDSGIPLANLDGIQIQQVVVNLITNALDAMEATDRMHRRLIIKTSSNRGKFIETLVEDCGTGLPTESVEDLFDSFYTTKPKGLGMGLAISRGIIEAHGGRLWATANVHQGATFGFSLPVAMHGSDGEKA